MERQHLHKHTQDFQDLSPLTCIGPFGRGQKLSRKVVPKSTCCVYCLNEDVTRIASCKIADECAWSEDISSQDFCRVAYFLDMMTLYPTVFPWAEDSFCSRKALDLVVVAQRC